MIYFTAAGFVACFRETLVLLGFFVSNQSYGLKNNKNCGEGGGKGKELLM